MTNYERYEIWVNGKRSDDFPRPPQTISDSPGHMREFLDAVKTRNLETTCNVRYGHHLTKYGLLANVSYRSGNRLTWDDQQERIVGDPTANRFLTRQYRKPWKLKA